MCSEKKTGWIDQITNMMESAYTDLPSDQKVLVMERATAIAFWRECDGAGSGDDWSFGPDKKGPIDFRGVRVDILPVGDRNVLYLPMSVLEAVERYAQRILKAADCS